MIAARPTLLILHYDGGAFAGWQRQKAARTVQGDLEAALERLVGHRTSVVGAGRTDAGVHALGQAAAAAVSERALLAASAAELVGEHGFRGLSAWGQEKTHYRCRVLEAAWQLREDGTGLEFWITADRFLHRMVRILVGTMVDIARGRRPPSDLSRLLKATDNQGASPPAPPQGLFLVNVRYPAGSYADR